MTSKKPETPEDEWATLQQATRRTAERELDGMSEEEVRASLKEDGVDLEQVTKSRDAFLTGLQAELAKMAEPVAATPVPREKEASNVVPLALARARRTSWTISLLAAALVVALAAMTAVTIAQRDTPPPSPKEPAPQVMVDVHAKEVADLRGNAEAAAAAKDWKGCLAKLDEADAIAHAPANVVDLLRPRCTDGRVGELHQAALAAAKKKDWRVCVVNLKVAMQVSPEAASGPANFDGGLRPGWDGETMTLWQKCDRELEAEMDSKVRH